MEVRVRIPPSPTGKMHLGTAYTAFFNYLFAKKNKGIFIFRWEDTDQERSKKEFEEDILASMKWLSLNWDEGPYRDMDRLKNFQDASDKLLTEGKAYYCFCTTDELEQNRKEQAEKGLPLVYTGKCRNFSSEEVQKLKSEGKQYVVRYKMSSDRGPISLKDLVFGNVEFDPKLIGDFVIMRASGIPIYNFSVVVDDIDMGITHVLRGEDHISNTPKQIVLFEALGSPLPQFIHTPNILNSDRSGKLSKREGATAVSDYRKDGFLSEAILNYLALLGWSMPDDREIMSIEEMINFFDISKIRKSPAAFNLTKLEWLNGEYIRRMSNEELTKRLQEFLVDHPAKEKIGPVIPLIKERIKKLSDFIPLTDFLWEKVEYDLGVFQKLKIKNLNEAISMVAESMKGMKKPWEAKDFEQTFRALSEKLDLSVIQMFQLIRVTISGQLVTPPLFESIQILGEEEAIKRVNESLEYLKKT